MTTRITALGVASCLAVTAALLLPAGAARPGQPEESKPIDLKPPVLKQVRWQYLDERYWHAYIDGSGRAWFLIRTFPASGDGKGLSRFLTCPELPEDCIEIPGKNAILGFDRRNRFWEVGPYGLCCTDVRTGKFKQYRPVSLPKTPSALARKDLRRLGSKPSSNPSG